MHSMVTALSLLVGFSGRHRIAKLTVMHANSHFDSERQAVLWHLTVHTACNSQQAQMALNLVEGSCASKLLLWHKQHSPS